MPGQRHDSLGTAFAAIVDEARARVASGRDPDPSAEVEIHALASAARCGVPDAAVVDRIERRALAELARVAAVHRARTLLARRPERPATAAPPARRAALRARATITGNMDVRRSRDDDAYVLAWDAAPAVAGWEVRFSERESARDDYAVREELALPATATRVEVPLATASMRVHVLGRGRDGRLLRRAVISALTRETWDGRWQRRASAS